ncbi:MAG: aspartate 1-decarboxylase [Lachnospiraceae bacterium]|nr:aspartate 1-decarboxylase [Lachnospiraceae bacterium]MDY6352887.1 aspartate 1-decarboxylase [Lachnospiraceae bacterium]
MQITILKSKIHRAIVTQAELNYVGSITIDEELMEAAHIREYEKVEIADVENGERFSTYVIAGEAGSGIICLNGAAARKASVGDHVIIMCYANADIDHEEIEKPVVVLVDETNTATEIRRYEKHGKLV